MNIKLKDQKELEHILKSLKDLPEAVPDPIFRRNARIRIMNKIGATQFKFSQPALKKPFLSLSPPYAYLFASLLLFLILGTGTVAAAQSSLPGQPLYPIKVAGEKIILNIAPTRELKSQLFQKIRDRRIQEIETLEQQGQTELAQKTAQELQQTVQQAQEKHLPKEQSDPKPPEVKKESQPQNQKSAEPVKQSAKPQKTSGKTSDQPKSDQPKNDQKEPSKNPGKNK